MGRTALEGSPPLCLKSKMELPVDNIIVEHAVRPFASEGTAGNLLDA